MALNPKDWESISITIDGKKVNMEDAFDVFEDLFEDVDEAFQHMEDTFSKFDTNISEKINKLKMKIAAKKPDKYEYVPDKDEDMDDIKTAAKENIDKQWDDHMEYRKTAVIRSKRSLHIFMLGFVISMLLLIAILFFIAVDSDKKDVGAPSSINEPAKITEKLEPL
jgi:hypothetical protein